MHPTGRLGEDFNSLSPGLQRTIRWLSYRGEVLSSWLLPESPRIGGLLRILSGEFQQAVLKTTAWENKKTKATIKVLPNKTNPHKMNYYGNCREGEEVGGSTAARRPVQPHSQSSPGPMEGPKLQPATGIQTRGALSIRLHLTKWLP